MSDSKKHKPVIDNPIIIWIWRLGVRLWIVPRTHGPKIPPPEDLVRKYQLHNDWLRKMPGGQEMVLRNTDLTRLPSGSIFQPRNEVKDVDFSRTDCRGINLEKIRIWNCNFRHSRFEHAILTETNGITILVECDLVGATGLFGPESAYLGKGFVRSGTKPIYQRWGVDSAWGDAPSWEHLRLAGGLPIFGVSNIALIGLLGYSGIASWYNDQLSGAQDKASSRIEYHSNTSGRPSIIDQNIVQMDPAPAPAHLGYLLLAILALLVASMIYRVRCPDIIKTTTRAQHTNPEIEPVPYMSANYAHVRSRWICALIYIAGGGYAMYYLGARAIDAVSFFFGGPPALP